MTAVRVSKYTPRVVTEPRLRLYPLLDNVEPTIEMIGALLLPAT